MISKGLSKLAEMLRSSTVLVRDIKTVAQSIETRSLAPILRRQYNKMIGKELHKSSSGLFLKGPNGHHK